MIDKEKFKTMTMCEILCEYPRKGTSRFQLNTEVLASTLCEALSEFAPVGTHYVVKTVCKAALGVEK